jgi:hypothetical protein
MAYSSAHLVGLFHPTATSRIHTPRGFPAAKPPCLSTHRSLMPLAEFSCRQVALPAPDPPARLQGFDPSSDPLRSSELFRLGLARSLPVLSPPRVFLRTPWRCLHSASTHDLFNQSLAVLLVVGLQRIVSVRPDLLSLDDLPVRDFRPSDSCHRSDPCR